MTARRAQRTLAAAALVAAALLAAPARPAAAQDTIPAGFGSLRRDDIVVGLANDQLQIQILPLDEQILRLLAPDIYQSLSQLVQRRAADIASAAGSAGVMTPTLVLVTFFGLVPQARFTPEDLNIQSRGRLFRPLAEVPLSPTWSSLQLDPRQQAMAIYLFDAGISWSDPVTVTYEGLSSDAWGGHSLQIVNQERSRVLARAQAAPPAH